MSKSYAKRYKITGYLTSDKKDKKYAHKKQRAKDRELLSKISLDIDLEADMFFADMKEISDVWGFNSDGGSLYISKEQIKKWFSEAKADYAKGLLKK